MKHSKRVGWVDAAKGIGIVLVVIGHTYPGRHFIRFIYLFHMPMFFILAGVVYQRRPVAEFTQKRAQSLLIPYLSFLAIVMVTRNCLAIGSLSLRAIIGGDVHQLVEDAFGGRSLTGDFGTFWFISCLIVALTAYNAIRQHLKKPISAVSAIIAFGFLATSYFVSAISLPWDISVVPMAIFFIWIGEAWSRSFADRQQLAVSPMVLGAALLCMLGGCIYLSPFDMKFGRYGTPVLSVLAAIAISHVLFVFCMQLANIRPISRSVESVGRSSLVILFTHRFIILHLRHSVPDAVIVVLATIIPYFSWLALKAGPLKVRRLLLGEHPKKTAIANSDMSTLSTWEQHRAID